MLDPQQEIFTAIRQAIMKLGYSVYDTVLPPEGTEYPFVYVGDTQQVDVRTKTQVNGIVYQMVDIWHDNPKRRGDVSAMALAIKQACFALTHTTNFSIDVSLNDQRIRPDKDIGITLLRCFLEFKITFS